MSEAPEGKDQQYKELSSLQRNVELNKLYQSLPEPVGEEEYSDKLFKSTKLLEQSVMDGRGENWMLNHPDYTSDAMLDQIRKKLDETIETRESSESKRELAKSLRSLLVHCSGTDAFKEYLIAEFSTLYIYGIDKENPGEEWVFRKLQIDNPESAGILDEKNIQTLEKIAYNHVYFKTLSQHSLLEQAEAVTEMLQRAKKLIGDGTEAPSFDHLIKRDRTMLNDWRQQYQDRYGNSPNA